MSKENDPMSNADEKVYQLPSAASDVYERIEILGDESAARVLAGVAALRGNDCVRELIRVLT